MISTDALFEELYLIKVAETEAQKEQPEDPSKQRQSEFGVLAAHNIRRAVPFALGVGAGMGLGYAGGALLRKYVPTPFVQRYSKPIGMVAGGLLAGSGMVLRDVQARIKAEEEELLRATRERNRQIERKAGRQ